MQLQSIRDVIKNDKNIQHYLKENDFFDVRYSNFGFIVILEKYVLKHYIGNDFFKLNNVDFSVDNFFFQESRNYEIINKTNNFLTPEYSFFDKLQNPYEIYISKIENIRNNNLKIYSFIDLDLDNFANLVKEFHSIKTDGNKKFIHGNIHPTNFFLTNNRNIGIFDFTSCNLGFIEQDLARIFIYMDYNPEIFKLFCRKYGSIIDYKKLLFYVIEHSKENFCFGDVVDKNKKVNEILSKFKQIY